MAKATKKASTTRRAPRAKKATRKRSAVRKAGFSIDPMSMLLGIAGAVAAPFVLPMIPLQDARIRNGIGVAAGYLGARMSAKKAPQLAPAFVGFALGSGVMLAADLFPQMGERVVKVLPGPGSPTIGRLNDAEYRRIERAVKDRVSRQQMNGAGMPVINGPGVSVINGWYGGANNFT